MILAGDTGGTKTNLALFAPESGAHVPINEATFRSADYPDLESVVKTYLEATKARIDAACFGVAGPVVGGKARITNLTWVIDEARLRTALNVSSVRLLNDLESIATSVPHLEPSHLFCLNEGVSQPGGAIAVIAPGTGLGEAFLTWDGTSYRAHCTEGGHTDFAPTDQRQAGLLRCLQGQIGHVSYERICSGIGIPNIYAFLKETSGLAEPQWLASKLAQAPDMTPVIVTTAIDPETSCPLCQATLEIFLTTLGAEAGNLALKVMATGGVYVGGGIAPRITAAMKSGPFLKAFADKGRMSGLLQRIPVHIILNPKTALIGAALAGLEQVSRMSSKEKRRV